MIETILLILLVLSPFVYAIGLGYIAYLVLKYLEDKMQ